MTTGGMPVIPVELHGCRFLTVRRPPAAAAANGADDGVPAFHQAPALGGSGASLGSSLGSLSMQIPMVPMGGPGPVVLATAPAPPGGPPDGVYFTQPPPQQHQYYGQGQGGPGPQVVQYPPTDRHGGYVAAPAPPPGGYTDHHAV